MTTSVDVGVQERSTHHMSVIARDDRAAVDKAVSLLLAFGDQASSGLGVSELARRAGLSKSTAYRVLGILERNDVVERSGTGYRLGARLHDLGRTVYAPGHDQTRDVLLPYLTDLYELTRQTVHLGVLHGIDVVYLAKLYGHRPVPAPSRIGGRLPAGCTAVGKALLAYTPDAAEQACAAPPPALTAHTAADGAVLAERLARTRRDGAAFDDEESRQGLSCVAVPVFDRSGRALAALSISVRTGETDTRRLTTDLRRVGAEATARLRRHHP